MFPAKTIDFVSVSLLVYNYVPLHGPVMHDAITYFLLSLHFRLCLCVLPINDLPKCIVVSELRKAPFDWHERDHGICGLRTQ